MDVSPSLIYYMLSIELNIKVVSESKPGKRVTIPMIYEPSRADEAHTDSDILYICNEVEQIVRCTASGSPCIFVGPPEQVAALMKAIPADSPCAIVIEECTPASVLYRVFAIMQALQAWDCALKDSCQDGASLEKVIDCINTLYPRPLILVNAVYDYLAYSKVYFETMRDLEPLGAEEIMPVNALNDLLLDPEFLTADKQHGVRVYPSATKAERSLFINFFKEGDYAARFLSFIGSDGASRGDMEMFEHAAHYLEYAYFRQLDEKMSDRQSDRMHTAIKDLLSRGELANRSEVADVMDALGWSEGHEFQVAAIRMFSVREFELSAPYLCNHLEDRWPSSFALALGAEIIWLIDCTRFMGSVEKDVPETIKRLLGDFACKAGLSIVYQGRSAITSLFRQALDALRLGEAENPHFWFYRFEDYAADYLLERLTSEYSEGQVIHEGLRKLVAADEEQGTEYVRMLGCYLSCGFNISRAAEKAFVHRSTFIRHLAKMKRVSGIDLSGEVDLKDLTHLLASLTLYSQGAI